MDIGDHRFVVKIDKVLFVGGKMDGISFVGDQANGFSMDKTLTYGINGEGYKPKEIKDKTLIVEYDCSRNN